jgi:hypothetical protein
VSKTAFDSLPQSALMFAFISTSDFSRSISSVSAPLALNRSCCGLEWLLCKDNGFQATSLTCLANSSLSSITKLSSVAMCGVTVCPCKQPLLQHIPPGVDCSVVVDARLDAHTGACTNASCPPGQRLYHTGSSATCSQCALLPCSLVMFETSCQGGSGQFMYHGCPYALECYVDGCLSCDRDVFGCSSCLAGLSLFVAVNGTASCHFACPPGFFSNMQSQCIGKHSGLSLIK